MPDIRGLIFSRDRAMQLDATLRSFFLHCADAGRVNLAVLHRATSGRHRDQYLRLARDPAFRDRVCFVPEQDFRGDVLRLLSSDDLRRPPGPEPVGREREVPPAACAGAGRRFVLLLVDDNIFVRSFALAPACRALGSHADAIAFSLRLGLNTAYCYALDRPQAVPPMARLAGGILSFEWTAAAGDFGYPLEVSSSIYRGSELLALLHQLPFENPTTLEARLAEQAAAFVRRAPRLLCFERSVTFCNAVNRVQQLAANRSGTAAETSSERLAELFEQGYRIRTDAYAGTIPRACHQEVPVITEKRVP